jgi:hypothetical protein
VDVVCDKNTLYNQIAISLRTHHVQCQRIRRVLVFTVRHHGVCTNGDTPVTNTPGSKTRNSHKLVLVDTRRPGFGDTRSYLIILVIFHHPSPVMSVSSIIGLCLHTMGLKSMLSFGVLTLLTAGDSVLPNTQTATVSLQRLVLQSVSIPTETASNWKHVVLRCYYRLDAPAAGFRPE